MERKMENIFTKLRAINVNDRVETKKDLTYLPWSVAWEELKKVCPDAVYEVLKSENGLPYFESKAGVMVFTRVTAGGITNEMWLPVMDGANKALKAEPYKYKTKFGEKVCEAFDMFDVNKTIMRCLTKNIAMFGLGLYIYEKEGAPESDGEQTVEKQKTVVPANEYSSDEFSAKEKAWEQIVLSSKKSADDLIAFLESKGKKLTDEQKSTIKNWGAK
jgi:hypothetical protein